MGEGGLPRPESLLARSLREREVGACEAFVDAHYQGVFDFLLWLCGDADAAADLTQESFAGFWESLDRLGDLPRLDLKAWLYGIARNRWRKRCRDHRPPVPLEEALALADSDPGPETLALQRLDAQSLAAAVANLPPDFRETLLLRVMRDFTYAEIAAALGISEALARWRVHRARRALRTMLAAEDDAKDGSPNRA